MIYLNLIWHQHQPSYLDPALDQLQGPWVRVHGTKDYYDMAAMLRDYPDVHCTFNLTTPLLRQLQEYYVDRLKPFTDARKNHIRSKEFLLRWKGKTDPWIDLMLKPAEGFDGKDMKVLISNPWNALYITDVMIARFPGYRALREKARRGERLSPQEFREVKFWFFLAFFDPDFLNGKQTLPDRTAVDLTDLVLKKPDGTYHLKKTVAEEDCNRLVAETVKVLSNIIPVHKELISLGQIEVTTTPYAHPILPLLHDSDVARESQPESPMPPRYSYPEDADAQVAGAVVYFRDVFGVTPAGMWPAEGGVSREIVPALRRNHIRWIATDEKILQHSLPPELSKYQPYRIPPPAKGGDGLAVVFRDCGLSDQIGFVYQHYRGADAAKDFIDRLLARAPQPQETERLITVIVDGENAWEWYRYDPDGKEFLHSTYRTLGELFTQRLITTVTMSEYIAGNPARHVPPHPVASMQPIEKLYPGSWINANFDTWIGNKQKNRAWEYLLTAREDLARSGIAPPDPGAGFSRGDSFDSYAVRAWDEMYAAEGSDWFWWYGTNRENPAVVVPFDNAFRAHLRNIYAFARLAGGTMPERDFRPISSGTGSSLPSQGAMKSE